MTAGDGYKYYVAYEDAFTGHLKPERAERSILFHNEGKNRFADVSQRMGIMDTSWTGDASMIDVNDDGWPDLHLTNMEGDDQYDENEGGKRFVRKSRQSFRARRGGRWASRCSTTTTTDASISSSPTCTPT